jgi:hypothetical protein
MKKDLCERTFQFAVRIVKLYQEPDRKPGAGRTIGKQLYFGQALRLVQMWKKGKEGKVEPTSSQNTLLPTKKPEKHIIGSGFWLLLKYSHRKNLKLC